MRKLLLVAHEEMAYHLRQWAFYLTAIGMPLAFAALGALPRLQMAAAETPLASVETVFTQDHTLTVPTGYVDRAGIITEPPEEQAEYWHTFADEAEAAAALKQGEIESYYLIQADYLESGQVIQYSADPQLLTDTDGAFRRLVRHNLLRRLGDPTLADRVARPVHLIREGPPPRQFRFLPTELEMSRLVSAGLVVGLFVYVINVGGNLLLRALQREVRARVLEMMIVNTTATQFIGGKILGLAALSLFQAALTLAVGAAVYGQNPGGAGPSALPWGGLLLSFPYLLLGYLAYCGLIMGVAAAWPTLHASGPLLGMLRLASLSPLIGALFILPDPDGPLSVILTLLPLTSFLLMPFRLLLGSVSLLQWLAGVLILVGWATFFIWLSIRLFRAQGLLTGRPITPAALWQALRGIG